MKVWEKMHKIFILVILFTILFCKPKVKKGIDDPIWREESNKIASEICNYMEKCSATTIEKLPDYMQKQVKEEISTPNCIEKNKKSNIYNLRVNDPESAKTAFRECFKYLKTLSCEEMVNAGISKNDFCNTTTLLQENK